MLAGKLLVLIQSIHFYLYLKDWMDSMIPALNYCKFSNKGPRCWGTTLAGLYYWIEDISTFQMLFTDRKSDHFWLRYGQKWPRTQGFGVRKTGGALSVKFTVHIIFALFISPTARLVEGPGRYFGRLEVYRTKPDGTGVWLKACDDGSFDSAAAQVVCRELGYQDGVSLCCSALGPLERGFRYTTLIKGVSHLYIIYSLVIVVKENFPVNWIYQLTEKSNDGNFVSHYLFFEIIVTFNPG